jgi:hypothetical protein
MVDVTTDLLIYLEYALKQSDSPQRFAQQLASLNESDESLWELLSHLDQSFRRGRIPGVYFRAARYAIQRRLLGLPPSEQQQAPNPVLAVPPVTESGGLSGHRPAEGAAPAEAPPTAEPVGGRQIQTLSVPATLVDSMRIGLPQPAVLQEPVSLQCPLLPSSVFPPRARVLAAAALCLAVLVGVWALITRQSPSLTVRPEAAISNEGANKVAAVPEKC